jgi:Uma2 family endonuclease
MTPGTLPSSPAMPAIPYSGANDVLYEVVNGRYVELPPMSTYAAVLASRLHGRLDAHVEAKQLGLAVVEALFGLDPANRFRRRPDVAYVSAERWARGRPLPHTDPWPVVPDLGIEVVSPNDLAEELRLKIADYFRYGVQLVWVVWPQLCLVDVYESPTQVRVLTRSDVLDGGRLLPGFSLALADLFREAPAETAPSSGNA